MLVGVVALFNAVLSLREENSYRFSLPLRRYVLSLQLVHGWHYMWLIFAVNHNVLDYNVIYFDNL